MLLHGSSTGLNVPDDSVDHIVTDPPYFDNLRSGDLAAYFHVWLQQITSSETDWNYLLEDAAVNQQANGDGQYQNVLAEISANARHDQRTWSVDIHISSLNPKVGYLATALKSGDFRLINRYVVCRKPKFGPHCQPECARARCHSGTRH